MPGCRLGPRVGDDIVPPIGREGPALALKSPPRFSYHRGRKQNPPHKRWAPEAISYAWVPESKVRQRRNRKKGVGRFQPACLVRRPPVWTSFRSEEHTSELQSLMRISYAVFCLKKKNKYNTLIRSNERMVYTQS